MNQEQPTHQQVAQSSPLLEKLRKLENDVPNSPTAEDRREMVRKQFARFPSKAPVAVLAFLAFLVLPSLAPAQVGIIAINNGGERAGLFQGRFRAQAGGCTSVQASATHVYHHVVRERHVVHHTRGSGCNGGQASAYRGGGCTSSQAGGYYVPAPPRSSAPPLVTPQSKSGAKIIDRATGMASCPAKSSWKDIAMTECLKCGKLFGDIIESRLHIAVCKGDLCQRCFGDGKENQSNGGGPCIACNGTGKTKEPSS